MEPIQADETSPDEFRQRTIARIAKCLLGEFERGSQVVAHYRLPQILAGTNLITGGDVSLLGKQVEVTLNELAAHHQNRKLRADYHVSLNTLNGTCQFAAHMRHA